METVAGKPEKSTATSESKRAIPELLAPAGDWECARAAIANGADAIYFGLENFNARLRADNFTEADLPELVAFLKRSGARAYVTMNTLLFSNELRAAEKRIRALIESGIDAVITQDIGFARLIRSISPDFPIHASTQMTITSAAGVRFAERLGAKLVVLARELSIQEIETIRAELANDSSRDFETPLEVFVHGALCVAYSGQCLTSEALGGRSANRGECAQACRMPYELWVDGEQRSLGDQRFLLSPQDLSGLSALPELIASGVRSLKIEGRLKSPEYVASVTRVYRDALDALGAHDIGGYEKTQSDRKYQLEMAFSRGLYTGWLKGIHNQELAHARYAKKRGAHLGTVTSVSKRGVRVRLGGEVAPGDGVVFGGASSEAEEQGGRIVSLEKVGDDTELRFLNGSIDLRKIPKHVDIWKTDDPQLNRQIRHSIKNPTRKPRHGIRYQVRGRLGEPLRIRASVGAQPPVEAHSTALLEKAHRRPLTKETLQEKLGKLGDGPFYLEELNVDFNGDLILPISELNAMRRMLVDALRAQVSRRSQWTIQERSILEDGATPRVSVPAARPVGPSLIALVRHIEQLPAALKAGAESIYLEFENPKGYREAVQRFRELRDENNPVAKIYVAPPRIFKPGEEWILKQTRSCEPDGILARNYDHLTYFSDLPMRGDFSLNVANELTADYLLNTCNLQTVTASYDLNIEQLEALLLASEPERIEVTIHQRMPMFHMEHCVFCAFMSKGKDYRDCGRPCETHRVELKDRADVAHPLLADAGCRNTLYNGRPQTGVEYLPALQELGVRGFRVDFLNETPDQVQRILHSYRSALAGTIDPKSVWREFKLDPQLGVTRGQMEGRREEARTTGG